MSRFDSSPTVHRLPRSHWGKDLNNFDFTPEVRAAIDLFIAGEKRSLLMTGPPGNGKTHLSVGLYRWGVFHEGTSRAFWCDFPQFVMQVKKGYGTGEDLLDEVADATFMVCLDDFLGRELTPHELESILYPCIQMAHRNVARFVLTTNYSLDYISKVLTPHELDRVLDGCQLIEFTGESRRG